MSKWVTTAVRELVVNQIIERPMDGNHGSLHPKSSEYVEDGIPFIMASDISNGTIDFTNCAKITKERALKLRKGFSISGDVLLSHKATLGLTAIVPSLKTDYIILTPQVTYYRIIDNTKLNNRYLYYYFQSPYFQQTLRNWAGSGSTRAYISITDQLNLPVILPPINVQEKIAEILGSLDDKIELNRRMNETLEQMAMALYKHWFVDFGPFQDGEFVETELGLIPQGWTIRQLNDLVTIKSSSVNPSKNEGRLFLHYSIPAYDAIMQPILEHGSKIKSNKYIIKRNSILVSKLNPERYRIWTVYAEPLQYDRICSTEFIVYEPINERVWAFLNAYFRNDSFKNEFRSHASGTTGSRQRVNPRKTLEFKLVVPPDSILEQFNRICSDIYKIQNKNLRENEVLSKTRDYLLPRLLSGEIEVREAEEQVEEVLSHA